MTAQLPLAIWTTGLPVPGAERARGTFFEMITRGLSAGYSGEFLDVQSERDSEYPALDAISGIVVSGSPARLGTQDPWMLRAIDELRKAHEARVPVLGICFGHQLLGQAMGGRVDANPNGREIGTVALSLEKNDPLLSALTAPPIVVMTHLDSVVELGPETEVLATTKLERHAALRFGETTWGVQFHPEMDDEIVGYYLADRRQQIESEGIDVGGLLENRQKSEFGTQLLARFGRFCTTGSFD
jgi:GMP synthase (glutamine-hydrolysing)